MFRRIALLLIPLFLLTACGSEEPTNTADESDALYQITAAKAPYAITKWPTPLLSTHEWDTVFGGEDAKTLKYDRFGEVDELVFIAPAGAPLTLQRQIRKTTRKGIDTLYYKVSSDLYTGTTPLWVDGRFLDIRESKGNFKAEQPSPANMILALRSYEGLPFTWHGSSASGIPELLDFYPPGEVLSDRMKGDWSFKGFDSAGLLFAASEATAPAELIGYESFGDSVYMDLSRLKIPEGEDPKTLRANTLMKFLRPLDVIRFDDRFWVVLDKNQVIQTRYRSKFGGQVEISNLFDTAFGLLDRANWIENPASIEDPKKSFFVRRFTDTSALVLQSLLDVELLPEEEPEAESETEEPAEDAEGGEETADQNEPSTESAPEA